MIVTAEHALRRNEDISVTMPDGSNVPAALVGREPGSDLALLSIEAAGKPLGGAEPSDPGVGDLALVIGRSPNSGINSSMGIISAVSGPWRTWRGGDLDRYIRLDAMLFPGSSGGIVIDYRSRIVGVASSVLSRVAGLAVPASTVDRVADLLLEKGGIPQGYLGIGLQVVSIPEAYRKKLSVKNTQGIIVLSVEPGGPADRAGILVGDIVLDIEGKTVNAVEDLQSLLRGEMIGKQVRAGLIRGGDLKNVALVVGERGKQRSS
jgi:S1-C subfamily serine protease